jgi:hypothetical protein
MLPPGASPCEADGDVELMSVIAEGGGNFAFELDGSPVTQKVDLEFALTLLANQIRIYVGVHAPNRIFVHAGVVARDERAIVLPGLSFSGKSTLVLELVRAGATYYSDEFALIDESGLVHPYGTTISIRDRHNVQSDQPVESLDGRAGRGPLHIGAMVHTMYRPDATFAPRPLTPGRAVLVLLRNTLAARARPEEALTVLTKAVNGAVLLEGDRGEAAEAAGKILEALGG